LRTSIRDTGIGMAEEARKEIFGALPCLFRIQRRHPPDVACVLFNSPVA